MRFICRFWRPALYVCLTAFFAAVPPEAIAEKSFCLQYRLTGFRCAGCGVTRAFCFFMHGRFAEAAMFHPIFTYAVFPIALFLMLEDVLCVFLNRRSLLHTALSAVFGTPTGNETEKQ